MGLEGIVAKKLDSTYAGRRSQDWLESQLAMWKAEIRRAEEAVVQAKNALNRKKMMRISDRPPDTTDEENGLPSNAMCELPRW